MTADDIPVAHTSHTSHTSLGHWETMGGVMNMRSDSRVKQRRPARLKEWIGILALLLAAVVLVFAVGLPRPIIPSAFGGGWDYWFYNGANVVFLDRSIDEGAFPLWNPLSFCGTPFAALPMTAIHYPPHLLRSLLLADPTPLASYMSMFFLWAFHLLAAGFGIYVLARAHRMGRPGALVAAMAYMFNGTAMLYTAMVWQKMPAVACFPWCCLLVKYGLEAKERRGVWQCALGTGLLLGMALLAGAPQQFSYLCVGVFGYSVIHFLLFLGPDERTAALKAQWPLFALPYAVAILLGMVYVLPMAELAGLSARKDISTLPAHLQYVDRHPLEILEHLLVFSGSDGQEGRRGAGAGILLLALFALAYRPRRRDWLWILMALVCLDCSIGGPLPVSSVVNLITQSMFRYPSRLMAFTCLPLGLLAGMAVDRLGPDQPQDPWRIPRSLVLSMLAAALLGLLFYWVTRMAWLRVSPVLVLLPALLSALVIASPWLRRRRWVPLCAVLLVFVELLLWNRAYFGHLYTRVHLDEFGVSAAALGEDVAFWNDNYRGAGQHPNHHMNELRPAMSGFDSIYLRPVRDLLSAPGEESVYSHFVRASDVLEANHRGNLFLKRSLWLARQYVQGPLPGKEALFPPATTVYLPDPPPNLAVPKVAAEEVPDSAVSPETQRKPLVIPAPSQQDSTYTYSFSVEQPAGPRPHGVLALSFLGRGEIVVASRFQGMGVAPSQAGKTYALEVDGTSRIEVPLPAMRVDGIEAVITGDVAAVGLVDAVLLLDLLDEDHLIRIEERGPNHVTAGIGPLDGPRILAFLDPMYPGWRARVDGEEAPMFLCQDVFKGIELGPGMHRVEFVFRPRRFYVGLAISAAALLLVLAALAWPKSGRLAIRR